jgi:hypothetical protein
MLTGSIVMFVVNENGTDREIGQMDIDLEAFMKMRVTAKTVRGKVSLEKIDLVRWLHRRTSISELNL